MKRELKQQTKANPMWIDEQGISVQYKRISECDRLKEKEAFRIAKEAMSLNNNLTVFKDALKTSIEKVMKSFMRENELEVIGKGKGNYSFYNFDRSIKIEVSNNDMIAFDEMLIAGAKEKLDVFLSENVNTTDDVIRELVLGAFSSQKGKLDSKKVLSLLKYRSKVKNKVFIEALDMVEKAMSVNGSKTYYKVALLQDDGSYEYIKLDLSSI